LHTSVFQLHSETPAAWPGMLLHKTTEDFTSFTCYIKHEVVSRYKSHPSTTKFWLNHMCISNRLLVLFRDFCSCIRTTSAPHLAKIRYSKKKGAAKEVSVKHLLLVKVKLLDEITREILKHNMRKGKNQVRQAAIHIILSTSHLSSTLLPI